MKIEIPENNRIIQSVKILQQACFGNAYNTGWWHNPDGSPRNLNPDTPEGKLAIAWPLLLQISEIIEAAEGIRKNQMDDKLPHRRMAEVELADAVIRIFDLAKGLEWDIGGAIVEKLEYNRTREDHKPENRQKPDGKEF